MKTKRKEVHPEEILFDVSDTRNVKLGRDLHLPKEDKRELVLEGEFWYRPWPKPVDWNTESLLQAMEIAEDKGFDLVQIPDQVITWKYSFYCRINGQTYRVTEERKTKYGDINYKIELIS